MNAWETRAVVGSVVVAFLPTLLLLGWTGWRRLRRGAVPQDKACIDQNNIQQSLACLPIFLAGCQTLLVVVQLMRQSKSL